ncbi:MAG TPA: DUF1929 domain-containing protein [Polyangiaceae bacterium]
MALTGCASSSQEQVTSQKAATVINYGTWAPWFYSSVLAVHAALMPPKDANTPAKVVYFGGSEFEPTLRNWVYAPGPPPPSPPPAAALGAVSRNSWEEFNTGTGVITRLNVPIPPIPANQPQATPDDLFCAAHTHSADGQLVIVGGNQYYLGHSGYAGEMPADAGGPQHQPCGLIPSMNVHRCAFHYTGTRSSFRFDHATNTLIRGLFTGRGRWYPTVVRAYHGTTETFVTLSGHPAYDDPPGTHPHHHTPWIEVASATTLGSWQKNPTDLDTVEMYPRAFYTRVAGMSQGTIVVASPKLSSLKSTTITPIVGSPNQFAVAELPNAHVSNAHYWGYHNSAVLLPLRPTAAGVYSPGRILMTNDTVPVILDLGAASPQWRSAGSVPKLRTHANATILATGDVLVSGGVNEPIPLPTVPFKDGYDGRTNLSVNEIDVFREDRWNANPLANPWDLGASASSSTISRNYHHVALLLPNGTVLTAGGNKGALNSRTGQPSQEGRILRTELFIPWYAQPGVARPTINKTATLNPPRSGLWTITTGSGTTGTSITRVALIAPGSVTHSFNVSQRYVELWKNTLTATGVTVTVPADQAVLPSGWYMLVVSRSSNSHPAGPHVPSESHWVKVP